MHLGLKVVVAAVAIFIAAIILLGLFMVWTGQSNDMASAVFDLFRKISPFNL